MGVASYSNRLLFTYIFAVGIVVKHITKSFLFGILCLGSNVAVFYPVTVYFDREVFVKNNALG